MILALGASHGFSYHVTSIFEWASVDTNRGRILFHSAQEINADIIQGRILNVWVLFEEIRYVASQILNLILPQRCVLMLKPTVYWS